MGLPEVKLPPDLPNWSLIKSLLQDLHGRLLAQNITEQETGWYMQTIYTTAQSEHPVSASCSNPFSRLVQTVYSSFSQRPTSRPLAATPLNRLKSQIQSNVKKKLDPDCLWYGVMKYLKGVTKSDREHFLYVILPGIIDMALAIEWIRPQKGLYVSKKQNSGSTVLSRNFVCSIVACFFLCLFPERRRDTGSHLNIVNFTSFFQHLQLSSQVSKLRCFLHYFECMIERKMKVHGNIIFSRKSVMPDWMLDFDQLTECGVHLCPITVSSVGSMEESAVNVIQVDFANQSVGGGVLGRGRVQEEIKFSVCPELLAILLFMESLDNNEAISVSGFEQFSCHRGYADSLEFAGHYNGQTSNKMQRMVAIDALSYREVHPMRQYEEPLIMRDFNKALVGFCRLAGVSEELFQDGDLVKEGKLSLATSSSSERILTDLPTANPGVKTEDFMQMSVAGSMSDPDLSPHSSESVDSLPLMQSLKQLSAPAGSRAPGSQPPAFISGLIHGSVSCLRISPLTILSNVSHIIPHPVNPSIAAQPSSVHSTGATTEWTPQQHLSETELPVNAALVSSTLMSPPPHSIQHLDLDAVPSKVEVIDVVPRHSQVSGLDSRQAESSALTHSESFRDNSIISAAETPLVIFPPSDIKDYLNRWEFNILGNLSKVFFTHDTQSGILEGISSSVDKSISPSGSLEFPSAAAIPEISLADQQQTDGGATLPSLHNSETYLSYDVNESIMTQYTGTDVDSITNTLLKDMNVGGGDPAAEAKGASPFLTDTLYISVEDKEVSLFNEPENINLDSSLQEPTSSISPQSSISSTNVSPHASFTLPSSAYQEPLNGSYDAHVSADFFIPSIGDTRVQGHRRDSKESLAELREFLNSSSSGSRSSGSGPHSSCNSTWGSRSGSISSHGTNGSNDFADFWNHFRRRSSQLSDTSRRSSSSKHSSDFSTDLEDISESLQNHRHGVIEEEGGLVTLLTDYASQFVSTTVKSAVVSGATPSPAVGSGDASDQLMDTPCGSIALTSKHGRSKRAFSRKSTLLNQDSHDITSDRDEKSPNSLEQSDSSILPVSTDCSLIAGSDTRVLDSCMLQNIFSPHMPLSILTSMSPPSQSLDSGFSSIHPSTVSSSRDTQASDMNICKLSEQQADSNSMSSQARPVFYDGAPSTPSIDKDSIYSPSSTSCAKRDKSKKDHKQLYSDSQTISDPTTSKANKSRSSRTPDSSHRVSSSKSSKETKFSASKEAAAASMSPSSTESLSHFFSGASGPPQTSGMPKPKLSPKKTDHVVKCPTTHLPEDLKQAAEKLEDVTGDKGRVKLQKTKRVSYKDREEASLKHQKSRYVFSDVAAPPPDKRHKHRDSSHKKQNRPGLRRQDDKKVRVKPAVKQDYTTSPKFTRFVNSLAEISLSQAVLEGAELLVQGVRCHDSISDEVYNWFANKIITEVFTHVLDEIESREIVTGHGPHLEEIGASGAVHSYFLENSPILGASSREAVGIVRPKSKSILPSKSDTAASGSGLQRSAGSFKMVKFKEAAEEDAKSPYSSVHPRSSNTFQRQNISLRRRSSLDLPSLSKSFRSAAGDLTSPYPLSATVVVEQQRSLTKADLSVGLYQTAASIVSQVFQNISDTIDPQVLSPGSSCYHGTQSSSDTGAHSTGSRIHCHYDSFTSNIFSSSSAKASESPRRARRSVSPSIGLFSRKPMSRETLTSAYLKVDHSPQLKAYERRSSEPCQTSVQLSLLAFNNNKFNGRALEDKKKKLSRTDDDIGRGKTWRRGSLDGFSFDQRRNSCGFKDPVLSRFAEELMKADTSVPELVIVGSYASSSSNGSRRSSYSAFRDSTMANLENELLNTSFTSACSVSSRTHRRHSHLDRSRSRESRHGKSDSSDTEYWFPPPKFVGDEFQQEYNRQHSQDELQDYASFFAGQVVQEAVCVLRSDPDYMSQEQRDMDMFAENLSDQIMRDALVSLSQSNSEPLPVSAGEDCMVRRSEVSSFTGQGAIPKVKLGKPSSSRIISQPKKIPEKKTEKHIPVQSASPASHAKFATGRRGERRASSFAAASSSQQFLHPSFKPSSSFAWPGGARPKQSLSYTTNPCWPSSRNKRHSSPSPLTPSPHSSLQVPPRSSRGRLLTLAMRSKSESHCSEGRPAQRGLHQMDVPPEKKRDESPASCSSADMGSCRSDHTDSSLLYSSSSSSSSIDSIGPISQDRSANYIPPPSVFHEVSHPMLGSPSEHSRRQRLEAEPDQSSVVQFSEQVSHDIMSDALLICQQNKWLKYLSYHQPIATGNWGCGAYRGDPQLKFIIQWMAASIARTPEFMYYTFGDRAMIQAQDIAAILSGLTVGQLASLLREYCSLVYLQSPCPSTSPGRSWLSWQQSQSAQPSVSLFDFLRAKFNL